MLHNQLREANILLSSLVRRRRHHVRQLSRRPIETNHPPPM